MKVKRACAVLMLTAIVILMTNLVEAESTVTQTEIGPINITNSCTGETIVISGTLHIVSTPLRDGRVRQHLNINGSGESSLGVAYKWKVNTVVTNNGPDFVAESNERLIGQGPSDNEFMHITTTFTGGVFAVDTEIECR